MTPDRFEVLAAGLLHGRLTPAERDELLEAAAADPALARRLVALLSFEPLLVDCALGQEDGEGFVRRVQQGLRNEIVVEPFTQGVLAELRERETTPSEAARAATTTAPNRNAWRRRLYLVTSLVAALIILGIGLYIAGQPREPAPAPPPFARVEEVRGEVYVIAEDGSTPAFAGQALLLGQGVRTAGEDSTANVLLADGTRLELGLHTSVRLVAVNSGHNVFLDEGLLTAEVPARLGESPIAVVTTHAEVTPQTGPGPGTRFSLSLVRGSLRVELDRGAIGVRRPGDNRPLRLQPGEYAVVDPRAEQIVTRPRPPTVNTPPSATLGRHTDRVASLGFTSDSRTLASGGFDGVVRVWDVVARKELGAWAAKPRATAVAFSPNGLTLAIVIPPATGTTEGTVVELRDLPNGQKKASFPAVANDSDLQTVAFSPDSRTLASVDEERNISLWDIDTGKRQATFRTRKGRVLCLAFSVDGKSLTALDEYALATTWELDSGRVKSTVKFEGSPLWEKTCAGYSPNRRWFAAGTRGETVQLWEADTGRLRDTLHGHRGKAFCLAFSPDGALLAVGARDGTTKLWDVAAGRELATLDGSRNPVRSVAFAPDGKALAVGGNDGAVTLWDIESALRGTRTDLRGKE